MTFTDVNFFDTQDKHFRANIQRQTHIHTSLHSIEFTYHTCVIWDHGEILEKPEKTDVEPV